MEDLSLTELSERAGVPPRTIRFYIARGLVPGPIRSGRDAVYSSAHLRLLTRIKALQGKGMTLAEVGFALSPDAGHRDLPEPVTSLEYELSKDVVVHVRGSIAPWRHKMIRSVLAEAAAKLRNNPKEEEAE